MQDKLMGGCTQGCWEGLIRTGGAMLLRSEYGCVRVTRIYTIWAFGCFMLIGVCHRGTLTLWSPEPPPPA